MKNIALIFCLLSVISFNTKSSFAQESKKEIGICGETISMIVEYNSDSTASVKSFFQNKSEYCDGGRFEKGANLIVSLVNKEGTTVYHKEVFLNPHQFGEVVDPRTQKFIKTKITKGKTSRIVKLPKTSPMGDVVKVLIQEKNSKKTTEYNIR